MNQNMCYNCGGEIVSRGGRLVCSACGSYMPEQITGEEVALLYSAFQKLRLADFYEAEREFDDIIRRHPRNAQGYWGRLMSHYGIKYEKDYDGRCIPTCYATSIDSVYESYDYRKAMELADAETRAVFKDHADYIERVRKEWLEKASREKPYDIFISFKDSDDEELKNNRREHTVDSDYLRELYFYLLKKGYRVFFSRESLEDKGGEKYEPYIYAALSTAKVMLVYGSKPEYINATWVKNEWTRYQKRIRSGEKHPDSLIVAYKGFSPKDLPLELSESGRQHLDASKDSFYIDFLEIVDRIIRESDSKSKIKPLPNPKPKVEKVKKQPVEKTKANKVKDKPVEKTKAEKAKANKPKKRALPIFLSLFSLIIVGCIAGFMYFGSSANQNNDNKPSDPTGDNGKPSVSIEDPNSSKGLAFELNSDGTYSVSGIGTCTDTEIVIPATYEGKSVTSIGSYSFNGCSSLTSVTIGNGVTSIGESAFDSCSSLTSITIPDSVTSIANAAFYGCSSLTNIVIPNGVTSIDDSVFNGCSSLTSIVIPNRVKRIGYMAFKNCIKLTSVTIPNSVTSLGDSVFYGCRSLTNITIPNSVTSIAESAFNSCESLTSVTIPKSVRNIGQSAFRNCTNLTTIKFGDTVEKWNGWMSFGLMWNSNTGNYKIICTNGTISKN